VVAALGGRSATSVKEKKNLVLQPGDYITVVAKFDSAVVGSTDAKTYQGTIEFSSNDPRAPVRAMACKLQVVTQKLVMVALPQAMPVIALQPVSKAMATLQLYNIYSGPITWTIVNCTTQQRTFDLKFIGMRQVGKPGKQVETWDVDVCKAGATNAIKMLEDQKVRVLFGSKTKALSFSEKITFQALGPRSTGVKSTWQVTASVAVTAGKVDPSKTRAVINSAGKPCSTACKATVAKGVVPNGTTGSDMRICVCPQDKYFNSVQTTGSSFSMNFDQGTACTKVDGSSCTSSFSATDKSYEIQGQAPSLGVHTLNIKTVLNGKLTQVGTLKFKSVPVVCSKTINGKPSEKPSSDGTSCICLVGLAKVGGVCKACKPGQQPNSVNSACESCGNSGARYVSDKGAKCIACVAGKQANAQKSACSPCAAGKYAAKIDALCKKCDNQGETPEKTNSATKCTKCGAGKKPKADGVSCESCLAYQYGTNGISCLSCSAGSEVNSTKNGCATCKAGFAAAGVTASCTACAFGKAPNDPKAPSTCVKCDAGKASTDGKACKVCAQGYQSNAGKTACTACVQGAFSKDGTSCVTTTPGFQAVNATGSFVNSMATKQTACPAGTASNVGVICAACPVGKAPDAQQQFCLVCTSGTASAGGQASCAKCPAGKKPSTTLRICEACTLGRFSGNGKTCSPSAAGKQPVNGTSGAVTAKEIQAKKTGAIAQATCDKGFVAAAGNLCSKCTVGQEPNSANSVCLACGTGKASGDGKQCRACTAGQAANEIASKCNTCVAGRFSAKGAGCVKSDAGRQATLMVSGKTTAKDTTTGAAVTGATAQTKCPKGQSSTAGTLCQYCAAGKQVTSDGAGCDFCQGTYTPGGGVLCKPCPVGQRPASTGAKCEFCPTGQYFNTNTRTCGSCSAGQQPNNASSACGTCGAGTYSADGLKCKTCPTGSTPNAASSASGCVGNKGYFPTDLTNTKFQKCAKNDYSDVASNNPCLKCGANQVTLREGSTLADDCVCASGFYDHTRADVVCAHNIDFGVSGGLASDRASKCAQCPICATCPVGAGSPGVDLVPRKNYFMWSSSSPNYLAPEADPIYSPGVQCISHPESNCTKEKAQAKQCGCRAEIFFCDHKGCVCGPDDGDIGCVANSADLVSKDPDLSYDGNCTVGYTGVGCGVCDVDAKDGAVEPWLSNPTAAAIPYGRRGKNCAQCNSATKSLIFITLILLMGMLVFIVKYHSEAGKSGLRVSKSGKARNERSSRATTMFLAYLQVTFFMGDFQFRWPSLMRSYFSVAGTAAVAQLSFFDCLKHLSFYNRFAVYCLSPIVLLVIPLVGGIFFKCFAKHPEANSKGEENDGLNGRAQAGAKRNQWKVPAQAWLAYFLLLFMAHPAITKNAFEMYNCDDYGQISVLRIDKSLLCTDGAHATGSLVSAIVLFVFSLGVPLLGIFDIGRKTRQEKKLRKNDEPGADAIQSSLVKRYNFLLDGYKENYWYWEFVVQLRKVAVVILVVFFRSAVFDQTYMGLAVVSTALLFHTKHQPFESSSWLKLNPFKVGDADFEEIENYRGIVVETFKGSKLTDNTLETISLAVTNFTMLAGIACYGNAISSRPALKNAVGYLMVLANAMCALTFIAVIVIDKIIRGRRKVGQKMDARKSKRAAKKSARANTGSSRGADVEMPLEGGGGGAAFKSGPGLAGTYDSDTYTGPREAALATAIEMVDYNESTVNPLSGGNGVQKTSSGRHAAPAMEEEDEDLDYA